MGSIPTYYLNNTHERVIRKIKRRGSEDVKLWESKREDHSIWYVKSSQRNREKTMNKICIVFNKVIPCTSH